MREGATDCRNRWLTVTAIAKALRRGGPFPLCWLPDVIGPGIPPTGDGERPRPLVGAR